MLAVLEKLSWQGELRVTDIRANQQSSGIDDRMAA